jgi:hypothetical protein
MSKEVVDGLENVTERLEYIIDWLEENKTESKSVDTNSVDFISSEINSFSGYFKDIDSKLSVLNNNFSGFLDNISTDETLNDTPEVTQFNQSILDMITSINELKSSLDNLSMDFNVGINSDELSRIQEELGNNLNIKLDSTTIDEFINSINTSLDEISTVKVDLNIDKSLQNIQELKENLTSLNDFSLGSVDLEVFKSENIDSIIEDLEALNSLEIDLNIDDVVGNINELNDLDVNIEAESNINDVINSLKEIKELDLSNLSLGELNELTKLESIDISSLSELSNLDFSNLDIDISKLDLDIDLTNILSDLDLLTDSLDDIGTYELELNIKDNASEIIDKLKLDVENLTEGFSDLDINVDVDVLPSTESIGNLQDKLDKQELSITPMIDSSQIESLISDKFEININPIEFEGVGDIETNLNTLESINTIPKNENENELLITYLTENNKVLTELTKAITDMNSIKDESNTPITVQAEKVVGSKENNSMVSVNSPDKKEDNVLSEITPVLQQLVKTNLMIMKKMSKIGFNTDMDF